MRILITTPTFPPQSGGVAEVVARQCIGLRELGHEVTVYCSGKREENDEINGIKRFPVSHGGFPRYAAGDWLGICDPKQRKTYQKALIEIDAEIILSHCWQAWNTDWLVDVAPNLKIPIILFSHGTSVNTRTDTLGWLRYARWRTYAWWRIPRSLRRTRALIALSDYSDQDRFKDIEIARAQGARVHVIPNGCSQEILDSIQPCTTREQIILSVGQYTREKNFGMVLDAFCKLNLLNWRLIFCGSHETEYLAELKARANFFGIEDRIEFKVGLSRQEIVKMYKKSTIFAFASKTECQPLVLLDAMAAGIPFVSSNVGCISRLKGGFVANNKDEFINYLGKLVNDPALRLDIGSKGRETALHNHRWSNAITLLEDVLKKHLQYSNQGQD